MSFKTMLLRFVGMISIVLLLQSCARPSPQADRSPLSEYDEMMTFERFSSVPLRSRKVDLEDQFGAYKTELERAEFPEVIFWILRNPRTDFQKASFTFDKKTQTLIAKLWLVSDGEPEKTVEVAKSRFKSARFSMVDLPSENPHLLYGARLLADEKAGISMEVNRTRNEISSVQWSDPSIRQPARTQNTPKPQYSF